MIRGLHLAAASIISITVLTPPARAAETETIPFKQSPTAPRDIKDIAKPPSASDPAAAPDASPTAASTVTATRSDQTVTLQNFRDTLEAWRSARKRLHALHVVGKRLQGDPTADKEVVSMITLMAIEKTQAIEKLRAELAAMLIINKLDVASVPLPERDEIVLPSK